MWHTLRLVAVTTLVMTVTAADADVIQTFNVSGNATESGSYFGGTIDIPADGTLIVDYTSGMVESIFLTPQEPFVAELFWNMGRVLNGPFPTSVALGATFSVPLIENGSEGIAIPVTFTLSDQVDGFYTDGTVEGSGQYSTLLDTECLGLPPNPACTSSNVIGFSGTLTSVSITPIPASLPLFAAGLGAVGLLCWPT